MVIRVLALFVMSVQQLVLVAGLFLLWSVKDGTGIVTLPSGALQAASMVVQAGLVLGSAGIALGYIGLLKEQRSGAAGTTRQSDRA
ncbi:hypothetical protein ACQP25_33680 [Microtetraspora malaysiensis]|uniref:hypothetical protein n=1 Tax=Microtetraspora malaysiensis TaxID=161358 RepID=UPI003D935AB0